jgi:predicted Zn-dependent peptidase
MKFNEHLEKLENEKYTIVENHIDGTLVSYNVTYKFAGKTLTEEVEVAGLSKKTSKKKLDDCKKKLKGTLKYVKESTAAMGNPGTDLLQNDFGKKIFPQAFTTDTTTLTPKEVLDVVKIVALAEPSYIKTFINQAEDSLATAEKLGQMNRADDIKIRIAIAKNALLIAAKPNDPQPSVTIPQN